MEASTGLQIRPLSSLKEYSLLELVTLLQTLAENHSLTGNVTLRLMGFQYMDWHNISWFSSET